MTPEILDLYQQLEATIGARLPDGWTAYLLKVVHDDAGFGLRLRFTDATGQSLQFTPVPSAVFDVIEAIHSAMSPHWSWIGMTYIFDKSEGYQVNYNYGDA